MADDDDFINPGDLIGDPSDHGYPGGHVNEDLPGTAIINDVGYLIILERLVN